MLKGFPLEMHGDGDASPLLVDLAGNDSNQLVVANSDGWIHAYQYNPSSGGLSDLPGWPVHTERAAAAHRRAGLHQRRESSSHYAAGDRGARPPATSPATAKWTSSPTTSKATSTRGTRRAS